MLGARGQSTVTVSIIITLQVTLVQVKWSHR